MFFFSGKILTYTIILAYIDQSFNYTLTNDTVSFEQLDPEQYNIGRVKRKIVFEHAQNTAQSQIQIIMRKLSSGSLLSIPAFCNIHRFC